MSKIRLVFARTECSYTEAWSGIKTVVVDVPLDRNDGEFPWELIGGEWLETSVTDAEKGESNER